MRYLALILVLAVAAFGQNPVERVVRCTDAGSSDTYACTPTPAVAAYTTGLRVRLYANTANTGAATVNISAVGAITIKKVSSGVTTDLADNDIRAGQYVELIYDGTNFQMLSQLGNAGGSSGTTTKTLVLGTFAQNTVPNGATTYGGINVSTMSTELSRRWQMPVSGTFQKLYVGTNNAQPAGCNLTVTLRNNTAGADTALTVTIPGGSAAGVFSDTTHTASITAGDYFVWKLVNGACTSAQINNISLEVVE